MKTLINQYRNQKKFDIIYFGLLVLAISFVLYMGVDFASATTSNTYDVLIYKQGAYTIAWSNGVIYNSTDSASVVQNVNNYLSSSGHVYVKNANYTMNSRVHISHPNFIFDCESNQVFFIRNNNVANQQMIYTWYNHDVQINNCSFDGNYKNNMNDSSSLVGLEGNNIRTTGLHLYNYRHLGMDLTGQGITVRDCVIHGVGDNDSSQMGIWFWSWPNRVNIDNCDITNNEEAALFGEGSGIIQNNNFSKNSMQYIPVGGGQVAFLGNFTITNNFIYNAGGKLGGGIELNDGNYIIIGNHIYNNLYGIACNLGTKSNVIAMGNIIQKNWSGFPIECGTGVNMTDLGNIKQ